MLVDEGSKTSHIYGDITIKFHQPVLSEWVENLEIFMFYHTHIYNYMYINIYIYRDGSSHLYTYSLSIYGAWLLAVPYTYLYSSVWWHVFEIHVRYQHEDCIYIIYVIYRYQIWTSANLFHVVLYLFPPWTPRIDTRTKNIISKLEWSPLTSNHFEFQSKIIDQKLSLIHDDWTCWTLYNPRESHSFEKINPIEALWNWSPSSYKPHPPKHTYNNTYTNIHHHILNIFRFRVNLSKAWSMIVHQPELRFELANKTTYALSLGYVAHWWPLTKTWLLARLEVVSSLQTSHPGAIEQPGGWAKLERLGRQACLETGDLELMVLGKSVQPHEWWMWCYRKYMQWVCSFYKTSIAKSLC